MPRKTTDEAVGGVTIRNTAVRRMGAALGNLGGSEHEAAVARLAFYGLTPDQLGGPSIPFDPAAVDRLTAHIGDRSPERRAAILALHERTAGRRPGFDAVEMDMVACRLFESMAISPVEIAMLSSIVGAIDLTTIAHDAHGAYGDVDIRVLATSVGEWIVQAQIPIGGGAIWSWDAIDGPALADVPETMKTATIGRPLREVVSHPVLDPLDLRIRSWMGAARSRVIVDGSCPTHPLKESASTTRVPQ